MTLNSSAGAAVHLRTSAKPLERAHVKLAPMVFDAYVGRYELKPGFIIEVSRDGDKFIAQASGQPKLELFASSATPFFVTVNDAELRFEKNADGAMQLLLKQGGREITGKRL